MNAIWKYVAAAFLALATVGAAAAKDKVVAVDAGDVAMNAAIAKARATLPQFWERYAKPGPGEESFGLKVAISGGGHIEHFWLIGIKRENGVLSGEINNDPNWVTTVKLGQRYVIPEKDISDWIYMRDGKIMGAYTMRALLDRMPPEQAADIRARLAPE